MLMDFESLVKAIKLEPWAKDASMDEEFWAGLIEWIEGHVLLDFVQEISHQVDEIVEIDPDLREREILERATKYMVDFLGAHSASVRIYDPKTAQMISYGSYPSKEESRATVIPLEGSIAGDVVKTCKPCLVRNILDEKRYLDKEVIYERGVQSLMAIPLEIPRFFPQERDTTGVIQIYYAERDRNFTSLEIQVATVMAKRLSYVIARKKILSMHKANEKREAIVQKIFNTIGTKRGVKMKEVFDRVIPELAGMVNLQSSALFSISEDYEYVILEAGYPKKGYHGIGKRFPVKSDPALELLLNLRDYSGDSVYELLTPSYLFVVDTQRSTLISESLKNFTAEHNINSILYVPLKVEGDISHFLTFDALDQRKRYSDEEIEIFLFLGRELMKAREMERLDDALHDFKNPAIATAGFARRLKKLVQEDWEGRSDQIRKYADILLEETSRLQELALGIYHVGDERMVDITDVLRRRFEINKEAIREQLKQNIRLEEGPFDTDLRVMCYVINVERVFDNLLNNATKAIPLKGGTLAISTYAEDEWACAEIRNTGHISQGDRLRLLEGEGPGRGLYITNRIIRLLKGKIEIKSDEEETTIVVRLPLSEDSKRRGYGQLSLLSSSDMG